MSTCVGWPNGEKLESTYQVNTRGWPNETQVKRKSKTCIDLRVRLTRGLDCRMVYEARKQSMAWMETDYSKHTHFRWKIKWRLEQLGALGIMGETAPLTLPVRPLGECSLSRDASVTCCAVRWQMTVGWHPPVLWSWSCDKERNKAEEHKGKHFINKRGRCFQYVWVPVIGEAPFISAQTWKYHQSGNSLPD